MIIKEINLTDQQVQEVKSLNVRIQAIKDLIKEINSDSNEFIFNKLINELAATKNSYDEWFNVVQKENNIITTSENSWNVDFNLKKLQLIK